MAGAESNTLFFFGNNHSLGVGQGRKFNLCSNAGIIFVWLLQPLVADCERMKG